jgi:hypothetical protein
VEVVCFPETLVSYYQPVLRRTKTSKWRDLLNKYDLALVNASGNVVPVHAVKACRGFRGVTPFFTLKLDVSELSSLYPVGVNPGERALIYPLIGS